MFTVLRRFWASRRSKSRPGCSLYRLNRGDNIPPMKGATSAQSNASNRSPEFGQTNPSHVAETAQSITARTNNNHSQQAYQHNKQQIGDVVVHPGEPRRDIFQICCAQWEHSGSNCPKRKGLFRSTGQSVFAPYSITREPAMPTTRLVISSGRWNRTGRLGNQTV